MTRLWPRPAPMVQTGNATALTTGTPVTFSTPFPSTPQVVATPLNTSLVRLAITATSPTDFTIFADTGSPTVRWIAVLP